MKVRIYSLDQPSVILGASWVIHKNAIEGLTIHDNDGHWDADIDIQARPGQVFVLTEESATLCCYQQGHELVDQRDRIVWPAPASAKEN